MLPKLSFAKIRGEKCSEQIEAFLRGTHNSFFSAVDLAGVISVEQINICYSKATTLFDAGSRIRKAESIFLMLLSGESQISKALDATGITKASKVVVFVYADPLDIQDLENSTQGCLDSVPGIPIPETDRNRDTVIFSRMARVQLSL